MSLSNQVRCLRLEYIPHFSQNPDRHFLGFSRSSQMSDRDWHQVRVYLRDLFFQVYWQDIRPSTINWPDTLPLTFFYQYHDTGISARVGLALLNIPDDYTEKSRCIKKINRCVMQALFALPSRTGLEADASLLMRLSRDRINPGVPTLEELCIDIASLHFSEAQIKHLPIRLQKTIICFQKNMSCAAFHETVQVQAN